MFDLKYYTIYTSIVLLNSNIKKYPDFKMYFNAYSGLYLLGNLKVPTAVNRYITHLFKGKIKYFFKN